MENDKPAQLFAWVGPDEFDGRTGIKQGFRPNFGLIPLVSISEEKMAKMREQLQQQADQYGKPIYLAVYELKGVVQAIEPHPKKE